MYVSANDVHLLADLIDEGIQADFMQIHLSRNLMETIKIAVTPTGFEVIIPAEMYDIDKWLKQKVIVYKGTGSYADDVDISGGWSGAHKGYIDNAINSAIYRWLNILATKYTFVSRKDI